VKRLCFILTLLTVPSAQAQLTPQAAAALMGRGINLGNTLEPPTEGAWNNPAAQEYYFDDYVEAGFQTVRIPVRWDQHTGTALPYSVDEAWMDRVEQVVDWGLSRNLIVIVNAHHEDWLKQDFSAENQARFDSIWTQVAARFADKSERLFMEIINEPQGLSRVEVDQLNARILSIIRETNPTRIVIFAGAGWSNAPDLFAAAIPDDDYLMAYYHSYDPWDFAGLANRRWGTAQDRADLQSRVQSVADWSSASGIPVMLSEFGAIHRADHNDRMKYYAAVVEETLLAGIPTQVWDDGGDFQVYNRAGRSWPEVKDILIASYPDGPTDLGLGVEQDSVVVVSWTNRYGLASAISVQRAYEGADFETLTEVAGSESSFRDTDVAGGITYDYRVIVRDAQGPDRYSYPQRFSVPAFARSAFGGVPAAIPGTVEAEDYDIGGEGLTYHDSDGVNTPGGYRPSDGVDLEARDSGGWQLAYVEAGEWLEYTVDVQTAGTYTLTAHVASVEGFGRFRLSFDGVGAPFFRAPATGSWQTTVPVTVSTTLEAGEQVMRLDILTANPFNIDLFEITLDTATGVEDAPREAELMLYPNPVGAHLTISGCVEGHAEIIDVLGRRLSRHHLGAADLRIDTEGLPAGLYVLRVTPTQGAVYNELFLRR
jgi:hypothetical protein